MSAGKNIEIKIAATGGDQAAREFAKIETSIREVQAEVDKLASNDYSPENQELLREKQEQLAELKTQYHETAEAAEKASEAEEKVARKSNIAGAALTGAGIGAAILGKTLGEIRKGFESLDVDKLRSIDAAMADQIETAKTWAEVLTDPVNGLQRLFSGSTIGEAFAEANEQLALNVQMQTEAVDRVITNGRRTAEELREVAREIQAANAILDARDAADSRERAVADAARIRGGAAPEDVAADRAAYDRDRKLEAINRGLDPKAAATQAHYEEAQQAEGNRQRVAADPRATREDQDKARKAADDARAAFEQAKKEYDAAKAVAEEQRRGVRAEYQGTVADATGRKSDRLKSEAEKQAAQEKREKDKAERDRLRAEVKSRKGGLDATARGAAREFDNAGGRVDGNLGETLKGIGKSLKNGTNQKEIEALAAEFQTATQGMGGATIAALRQMLATQQQQAKEIELLKWRQRNNNTGGGRP